MEKTQDDQRQPKVGTSGCSALRARTHIMLAEPYQWMQTVYGRVGLQKALCGAKEPISQARGAIAPTCKRCLKIWLSGKHGTLAAGSPQNAPAMPTASDGLRINQTCSVPPLPESTC
jgi:hypothetical protein